MERFSGLRRYQIPLGSMVYIGTKPYEMQSLGETTVTLYDPEFPLFTQEFPRADFDRKLEENPLNEQYFLPDMPQEQAQPTDTRDYSGDYRLLDRLRTDCEYFLGEGQRNEKHLWAGNVSAQIHKMRELYDALPEKPTWLTREQIEDYADRMAARYQVAVYHHFENGFDERVDYQTLEEAERVALGYVDGTMEDDGFRYDGAAVYDLKEERYLHIIGEYPDPAAHAQVRENALEHPVPEQGQAEPLPDLEAEVKAWEAEQAAKKQTVIDALSDREKIIVQAMETAGFLFTLWEGRSEITFSAGEFGYPSVFKTWDEAYKWINEAQLKDTPGLREQVQAILHPALDEKGQLSQVAPAVQHELTNEEYAQANLIPGETEFEQDGRSYRVHSVDFATNQVELTDLTFAQSAGFPILRMEYIGTIRAYLENPAPLEPPKEPKKSRTAALSNVLYPEQTDRHDHRITDGALGVGTPSQRYQNNIAAIRLLKQLESEERLATPEEQEILSRYVGWGGLADCFEETNRNYLELKNLLTPEEYEAARESTLTAFYTPPVVIRSMYQALEQMGFETGNVLEPSCGTGNFLGVMPERMSGSRRYAVELDEISGRIAQQLYQTASVTIQGYEKTNLPDSFFDVAIGNIPFGNFKVADRRYDKHNFLIHDYFFGKTLDKVRPDGIVAFITSKGTLDKESPAVRKYIAQRADLLGAIRLPNNTYGTNRINGYKIVEETLNLKDVRIFDYVEDADGRKTAVLNKKETAIAQSKQQLIKQAFADWIWKDPERRERLCKLYNETFNSIRPREYDGSHLNFVGINPEITLRRHQVNAIAHILYGGNTLLAHVVGAGKTFEIVAAAQESRRLGLCSKSLIAVPNHLTEQWAAEYLQLYPSANILVATKKDFEPKNRKKFCGRIATGDYDAIIIGHSQLEKIPMSLERQRAILEEQLREVLDGISDLKRSNGDNFSIKQMERTKKGLEAKLDKLNDQSRKDDIVIFEELGVERLFVDEAHNYKNLAAYTKMRNVSGISQTEAQKSSDLYMKCRYLDELTGGRGVVFATGTPISNSMVEMYTMQKYLQHDTLQGNDLLHFDSWASTFGETVTAIELAPEGYTLTGR